MRIKERYDRVFSALKEHMPEADTELTFGSTFQLLAAVILSAQCTDKRVNMVTGELFLHYPDAQSMAEAEPEDLLEFIGSVSYPNAKALHLVQTARMLAERFGGEVPSDTESLLLLPGVGRKTANVIQNVAFGQATVAVDTHVYRVSHRLGLVPATANTPHKVENVLLKNIPAEERSKAHHWLLLHGRYVCTARKPHCKECFLNGLCPSAS